MFQHILVQIGLLLSLHLWGIAWPPVTPQSGVSQSWASQLRVVGLFFFKKKRGVFEGEHKVGVYLGGIRVGVNMIKKITNDRKGGGIRN